ncbi:DsrE family protein [Vibrio sp. SCSIO 43135]|uniref:DsrE family protein n=1 Tax=Vibrio sp. SCSIO 43135 TaxID=2819096 RepID=UPI0020759BB4|nr:DsrE family protein [Vibrio sp. SCSIO 43135]USD43396.1 DsrE family protein [Vibrio sp. SCSIO 43135]
MKCLQKLAVLWLMLVSSFAFAQSEQQVAEIISSDSPPVGVVFEVMEWEEGTFTGILNQISHFSDTLKAKHPNIEVAVVSHGSEQFALLKENQGSQSGVHDLTQSLVSNGISVEVCATHASWYGKDASDFADHVEVVERAPMAIRAYQEKGYVLIRM